jgi:hypothetical protein
LGSATDIAAGDWHSCAIQAGTGRVVCWGSNSSGKATPPNAVNGVFGTATDISAGRDHSCAIHAGTGIVVCWGSDKYGQSTPPDAVNGVFGTAIDIAAYRLSNLAIVGGTEPVAMPPPPPTPTPNPNPTPTAPACPTYDPRPQRPSGSGGGIDCLCKVQNINPNQVVLKNVGSGGKGSHNTRKMVMTLNAVDGPYETCDPGEFSDPMWVKLKMVDDDGDVLVDSSERVVCEGGGVTTTVKWNVSFQGPLNCENGAVPPPKPDFSLGTITSTGSAPGTADYVESTKIKCFE